MRMQSEFSPALSQPPLMQPDDPIHLACKPLIMRCYEGCASFAADQAEKFVEHGVGRVLIEVPGGLIREH